MPTTVIVSGATGFIAQHIIKLLLEKQYYVVGTVRSAAKGEHLKSLFESKEFQYEIETSLEADNAFEKTLKNHPEATVFLHTASPVSFTVEDIESELLKPAIKGTINALKAIKKYGPQIQNVVVTSSYCASVNTTDWKNPHHVVNETSWSDITWEQAKENPVNGYFGSKKFAEKAAWDFFEQEKPSFNLNTVNPVYVFGPQAFDSEVKEKLNFSSEIINRLLNLGPESEIPEDEGTFVDVRDVAKAHLAAFENNWCSRRLLLSSENFSNQKIVRIIADKFESLKSKMPKGALGAIEPQVALADNWITRAALGFRFIDLETCVVDSVSQIMAARN